jgi:putative transposase
MDSQSVKGTPESADGSGVDGGKHVKGRKRHIVVDTIGYLLVVGVHAANVFDGKGARAVVRKLFKTVKTLKKLWADCAYRGGCNPSSALCHLKGYQQLIIGGDVRIQPA